MHESPINAQGSITEILPNGLFRVKLPNGKVCNGHLAKNLKPLAPSVELHSAVTMELTPFDFDSGRIVAIESAKG